jgi:colanic acid biosynthesis glycosyl transferase WcaI
LRLLVFYHFFPPDEVAGARQFGDLAAEQARRGWQVTAVTSNRAWSDPRARFPARGSFQGAEVRRVFRPAWPQARALPRLMNSGFLLGAWAARLPFLPSPDAVVIGSDPAFAALLAPVIRWARPRAAILHWCFDVYPEAIAAEGASGPLGALVPVARRLMAAAYRSCDVLVDLGPAMRARFAEYRSGTRQETLTPWALAESAEPAAPSPEARAALFPGARLALLYAGTLGRAHDFELLLALARACRVRSGRAITFALACRGNRAGDLRAALGADDVNVALLPFAAETELEARLGAADMHVVSLRPEWAGVVVPSKFFAALGAGRPVLYAGPGSSEIAGWIRELGVGLHLGGAGDVASVAAGLHVLADGPAALAALQARAHAAYAARFSRRIINDRWDTLLRSAVAVRRGQVARDALRP